MSEHTAVVRWSRDGASFLDGRFSRAHTWTFDGGAIVPASASPHVVGRAFVDPAGVDPEEAFVASLSSCHLLTFVHMASKAGWLLDAYEDEASGLLGKAEDGKLSILRVRLRPRVVFGGDRRPDDAAVRELHHRAHDECFIARSVKCEVVVEPRT